MQFIEGSEHLFVGFFSRFVEDVSQTTFTTVLSIKVGSHEDTSTTFLVRAFTSQSSDFTVFVNLFN